MNLGESTYQKLFPDAEFMGDLKCGFDFLLIGKHIEVKGLSAQNYPRFRISNYQINYLRKHDGYLCLINFNGTKALAIQLKINDIISLIKFEIDYKPESDKEPFEIFPDNDAK